MQLTPFVERIRDAAAAGTPLVIRGGGSKDFYGNPPPAGAALLDTRSLTGVLAYEPSELYVTVGAGTPLAQLQAELATRGQGLPFDPPHFAYGLGAGDATVGGMVGAGLSGPARASVGCVRDYVLGAALLNGRGEHLRFGGTVMKNVAGYDVSRVLAGAMGQLGLVTEVTLKVLAHPVAEATLAFEGRTQADALALLAGWGGQPLPLDASCWQATADGAADATGGTGTLWLRLRGARAAIDAACTHLGGQRCAITEGGASDAGTPAWWAALRDHRAPFFAAARAAGHVLWRVSVPQTAPVLAIEGAPPLIEWHGGLRWYARPPGAGPALRDAARAVGGTATLFIAHYLGAAPASGHLDAEIDARDLPRFTPPAGANALIQQRLLAAFDPAGVFNPGRMLARG